MTRGPHASRARLLGALDAMLCAMDLEQSALAAVSEGELTVRLATALALRRAGVVLALEAIRVAPLVPQGPSARTRYRDELDPLDDLSPAIAERLACAFDSAAADTGSWTLGTTLRWLLDSVGAAPIEAVREASQVPFLAAAVHAACGALLDSSRDTIGRDSNTVAGPPPTRGGMGSTGS